MKSALFTSVTFLPLLIAGSVLSAQTFSASSESDQPLPEITSLMHEVEQHQQAAEAIQKDYLYHETVREQREDKKSQSEEYDVFWLQGVLVHKLTRKDGKDLTADEQKKESERLDKEVEKAKERKRKADADGKETDSHGREEVTVSRFLELGTFTNPRRIQLNNRETIAVDYAGNPNAKTRNRMENVIRDLSGTIWVDEQDRTITRVEGHFAKAFKVGGGVVMSIKKDTRFSMDQKKINSEVWLPARIEAHGGARIMLVLSFNGTVTITESDYRKFKATSTILPGLSTVEEVPEKTTSPAESESSSPK